MKPQTCSRCGEEVRYGVRGGVTGWLHRESVDHSPIFGRIATEIEIAALDAALDEPRERISSDAIKHCPTYQDLWPLEVYTTREHDIRKDPDATRRALRLAAFRGEDPDYVAPLPEPEIRCHDVEPSSFAPRSGIRQITNLVTKTDGWELRRLTHARGPYVGAGGEVLSISDTVVLGARGVGVALGGRLAVASWRDGKFDFAYTGILKDGTVTTNAANSDALKAWIKENP